MVNDTPTEAAENKAFMHYLRMKGYKYTHIKNETGRAMQGGKVRNYRALYGYLDGVSPGFPDFLVIAGSKLIAIEMKRTKGGRASPAQLEWIQALQHAGVRSAVCLGHRQAIDFIEDVVNPNDMWPEIA